MKFNIQREIFEITFKGKGRKELILKTPYDDVYFCFNTYDGIITIFLGNSSYN